MTLTNLYRRIMFALVLAAPTLLVAQTTQQSSAAAAAMAAADAHGAAANGNAPAKQQQGVPAQQQTTQQNGKPAAAPSQAAQQALQNLKVQQLIQNVEASYNSGVANYRAGHLDAARLDFDYAVDTMLTSGLDLKTEGDLADEFDRLLNQINSLEMAALKQGNGFSPRLEEAPLDTVGDETFAANPELVAKLRGELNVTSDLPLVINDDVAGYIGVFSHSESFRRHMVASLQRVGKYRGLIQQTLKEEGVPQDLIYLAVAESGFQPRVVNTRSGAGGMWQFMVRDGAQYGLSRDGFYDYRFDPEKATRAYAKYIKRLYGMFGDWNLAMAAYDWGPGSVQRALARTGATDYWELYQDGAMPAETRAYVPKILAAVLMAKNPEVYGLDKLVPSPAVIYDTVQTNYAIDMRLVADVTGSSVSELVALNPALLRLSTPRDISFDLHIPPGTKSLYADRLKDIPEERRASWRFHVVKPGETLDGIAAALHAHASDIAATNGITSTDPMSVDDELVVPVQSVSAMAAPQRYTWHTGDTLLTVADRFNVSVEELRDWNSLTSSSVRTGKSIYVAEPVRLGVASHGRSVRHSRSHGSYSRSSRTHVSSSRRVHASSSHAAKSSAAKKKKTH